MSKFIVGEIAIIAATGTGAVAGDEVEIVAVGPFRAYDFFVVDGERFCGRAPSDYVIRHPRSGGWFIAERDLRKRPQRGIPDAVLRIFEQPRDVPA